MDAATAGQATVISTHSVIKEPPRPNTESRARASEQWSGRRVSTQKYVDQPLVSLRAALFRCGACLGTIGLFPFCSLTISRLHLVLRHVLKALSVTPAASSVVATAGG